MISHAKDVYNPSNPDLQPVGTRYCDFAKPPENMDRPTLLSWVLHGVEKLMCPGTVSSQVDVLSDWMLEAGLALAEYPVLA